MRKIAITQRVEYIEEYAEYRDSLDHAWTEFATKNNCLLFPLASLSEASDILNNIKPDILILSGGNSLGLTMDFKDQASTKRDKFERKILKSAIDLGIPVFGVCRGTQFLNVFFGGTVSQIKNHINLEHKIKIIDNKFNLKIKEVNSFHEWAILKKDLAANLTPFAVCDDDSIEGFYHNSLPVYAVMWHPEREQELSTNYLEVIFKEYL